eukprot:INCI19157.1.p1 GENE.INCI19157.1~~INCI19157.1.p1  ORF type:complete len:318 (+),score=23.97 INCI19157.1:175-1128(+)
MSRSRPGATSEMRALTSLEAGVAGGFGGVCNIVASQPLDSVKVLMQNQPKGQRMSVIGTASALVRTAGVRGLYSGMLLPATGVVPVFSIMFGVYDLSCKELARFPIFQHSSVEYDMNRVNLLGCFAAGIPAGLGTSSLMCVGERIKCLLQVDAGLANPRFSGPGDVAKQLFVEGGVRSLFKGMLPTLGREVVGACSFFGFNAWWRALFLRMTVVDDTPDTLRPELAGLAGGLAGAMQWTIQLPLDTIKTKMQSTPMHEMSTVREVVRDIWVAGGRRVPGFVALVYTGWGPAVGRAFVGTASCFLGIEALGRAFRLLW